MDDKLLCVSVSTYTRCPGRTTERSGSSRLQLTVSVSVSVSVVDKKKKLIAVMASAVPPLTMFHLVNLWTLLNAFSITFAFAYDIVDALVFPRDTTGEPMTTADEDDGRWTTAILWSSAPQAFAGTLALLLPCHWRRLRRASAYVGLVLTVAGNCIWASAVRAIVVDDPGNLFLRIGGTVVAIGCAVCDLLGLMALVRGAEEEEQEA